MFRKWLDGDRWEAITWTNADPVRGRIHESLSFYALKTIAIKLPGAYLRRWDEKG